MRPPVDGDRWLGLCPDALPVDQARAWAVVPRCGAVVLFCGTVRDHADGRAGVSELAYEAYAEQVEPRLTAIADDVRVRWPAVGRVVMLHRTGRLDLTDVAVVVAVSAPHRDEAFAAARFCIDTLKATVPIWKKEAWDGGSDWGTGAHDLPDRAHR